MIRTGPEVLDRRDRHAQDPPRAGHHHLAGVAQVAGQEDDQTDLGELRRLEHEQAGDAHAQVRAVGLVSDAGQPRQDQQAQRHHDDDVAVLLELAVVAKRDDRDPEQDQPEHEPLRLLARERGADPVDHHDPEARQQRDQREHVRIGVRQRHPDEDVPGDAQPQEDRAVGQRDVREDVRALDEHAGEPGGQQQRGRDQTDELTVACAHFGCALAAGQRTKPPLPKFTARSSPSPSPSPATSHPTASGGCCSRGCRGGRRAPARRARPTCRRSHTAGSRPAGCRAGRGRS